MEQNSTACFDETAKTEVMTPSRRIFSFELSIILQGYRRNSMNACLLERIILERGLYYIVRELKAYNHVGQSECDAVKGEGRDKGRT